jgi:hypothetical protein
MTLSRRTCPQPRPAAGILAAMTASQIAFYATVATVIPVLYIALAVQARVGVNLVSVLYRVAPAGPTARAPLRTAAGLGLIIVATCILVGGAGAEFLAMLALYDGGSNSRVGLFVLWLTLLLIAAVAAGPLLDYFSTLIREGRALPAAEKPQASEPAIKPQQPDMEKQSATPQPEAGKTDAPSPDPEIDE